MSEVELSGKAIIAALKQARIEYVVALPDATMSENVLWPLSKDKDFSSCACARRTKASPSAPG